MGTLPTMCHIFFLYAPPCCQDVRWQEALMHTPNGGRWISKVTINQTRFIHIYIYMCIYIYTFFQCFALSCLPSFFKTYIYLWHLFDRYFPDIYLINKYDIDSRNSKNPTCTHTHTTHQTSLPPCQQFLGEFNESLGLGPFRINQTNIK
jgi:hypothetical protein